jgi:hypothetical protein
MYRDQAYHALQWLEIVFLRNERAALTLHDCLFENELKTRILEGLIRLLFLKVALA